MNKIITFLVAAFFISQFAAAQSYRSGDLININGVQAFVFYVDDSGEHGLAMSSPAVNAKMLKKMAKTMDPLQLSNIKVLDLESYEKAGMLKKKSKETIFTELIPLLSDEGEANANAIAAYCQKKGWELKEYFPWQYWASELGEGWFIPGDKELTLFANFYTGGLQDSKHGVSFISGAQARKVASNPQVQTMLISISAGNGLISSTAKSAEFGFRTLHRVQRTMPKPQYWFELLDNVKGSTKELDVNTCAVHKF